MFAVLLHSTQIETNTVVLTLGEGINCGPDEEHDLVMNLLSLNVLNALSELRDIVVLEDATFGLHLNTSMIHH